MLPDRIRSWRWWPGVFIAALCVFVAVGEFWAAHRPNDAVEQQRHKSTLSNPAPSPETPDDRIANYTLWLERWTGALSVATLLMWYETRRSISHSRKASERELRAYVTVKLKGVQAEPDKPCVAHIRMLNRGQTPASDVRVYWQIVIWDEAPAPAHIDQWMAGAKCAEDSRFLIGPREGRAAAGKSVPILGAKITAVRAEKSKLWVVGRVEYTDAFDESRTTWFCHYYTGADLSEDAGAYAHYGNSYT